MSDGNKGIGNKGAVLAMLAGALFLMAAAVELALGVSAHVPRTERLSAMFAGMGLLWLLIGRFWMHRQELEREQEFGRGD
jgi:hypothetical protein